MTPRFKVLIAGGGPVGLTAALALSRAENIDFTVLEKHQHVVSEAGSDLVLSPIGLRALSQLGLYDELVAASTPLGTIDRVDHHGNDLGKMRVFEHMRTCFGQSNRVLRRYDLCRILYNALASSSENVICGKEICDIRETGQAVTAVCADGTSYTADMMIGADGVHSAARRHIIASSSSSNTSAQGPGASESDVLTASYRCLWIRFPTDGLLLPPPLLLPAGTTVESHGRGASTQMFVSRDGHAVAGLYEKMDRPLTTRVRFTRADEQAMVRRWADLPLSRSSSSSSSSSSSTRGTCTSSSTVTLGSAYGRRTASGMVALQEGVRTRWSSDAARVVLVGDAAHVFSPITGAGCNNGIIDVVVLVNKLRRMLFAEGGGGGGGGGGQHDGSAATRAPGSEQLGAVFAEYQEARKERVGAEYRVASRVMATASWDGIVRRVVDQYVVSMAWVQKWLMDRAAADMAKTPCFDFLPADRHVIGLLPWQSG